MSIENYTREILVSNTPTAVFRALTTEFDKWWTPASTSIAGVGDVVTFRFDPTYWTMRVTRLVPGQCVELECMEAHHVHEGLPDSILKEWEGTLLQWDFRLEGDGTRIVFVHQGLVPSLSCYEICEQGWDHFFVNCLKRYLDREEQCDK